MGWQTGHVLALLDFLAIEAQKPWALGTIISLLAIALTTRFITGSSATSKDGKRTPGSPPQWLPLLGHRLELALFPGIFLRGARARFPEGVFGTASRTYVYAPKLVTALLGKALPSQTTWRSVFGVATQDQTKVDAVFPEGCNAQFAHLDEDSLKSLTASLVAQVSEHAADLVTFNTLPLDHMDWERVAEADLVEQDDIPPTMDVDLLELVRNFMARTASTAVFGTDFAENFLELWPTFWKFDGDYGALAADHSAWMPSPRFQRARLMRGRLLAFLRAFHEAMELHIKDEEPPLKWSDLDNASDLVRERARRYKEAGMSIAARASCDLALLWAVNTSAGPVTTWMLFETFRDPILLEQVREEIAPYIQSVQPENEFGLAVWMAPKLQNVDVEGLAGKCPLLMAAYVETLRVYTAEEGSWRVEEDVEVEGWVVKKGTIVKVDEELHHTDPIAHPDPEEWLAKRHITDTGGASHGSINPLGKSPSQS